MIRVCKIQLHYLCNFEFPFTKRASNCSIMENIPPKGVICSDFICTLAMSDEDL